MREELCRSDPAAFDEFSMQPVGHSKQGDSITCVEQKTLGKQPVSRGFTKDKSLSSIFNTEMVKDKTAEEIKQIWQQYLAAKDNKKFDLIWNWFFVWHWTGTELHFTALTNIQIPGEAAASQLILYHYPALKEENGTVLMAAEMDSTFLNDAEAQCVASQVQLFYATDREETYRLGDIFNFRPKLEQSGLGAELKCSQNQDKT
uniref:ATP synthase mitochondrial F1 complex assembly factor 1 n=1 Tax=Capra hircus TaxID=9925 RepID=A0A452G5D7_CAPHI